MTSPRYYVPSLSWEQTSQTPKKKGWKTIAWWGHTSIKRMTFEFGHPGAHSANSDVVSILDTVAYSL